MIFLLSKTLHTEGLVNGKTINKAETYLKT